MAIRQALEGQGRIDYAILTGVLVWLCRNLLIWTNREPASAPDVYHEALGRHLPPLHGDDFDALAVAAQLIDRLGPQSRLQQAKRNTRIAARLKNVDRFSSTLSEVISDIASVEGRSVHRIEKIGRGRFATPALAEFINSVNAKTPPAPEHLLAAQKALYRIRRRLMANDGKGEALRAKICTGFGSAGKTEFAEELHADVESLRQKSLSLKKAVTEVAKRNGVPATRVKTDHQRVGARHKNDIYSVVKELNELGVERDDQGKMVAVLRVIPDDVDLDKTGN